MKTMVYVMALFCMFLSSGCASTKEPPRDALTPLPEDLGVRDPDNELFMRAVAEYIKAKDAPGSTQYEFTRIDLNNDGRREGIVLMKGPHSYWCGFNGCSMVIFKAQNTHFELLSEVAPVRGPLTVSAKSTNGWSDIVVRVSGRMNSSTRDVALQYDGNGYPSHPDYEPQARYAYNDFGGVRIFP